MKPGVKARSSARTKGSKGQRRGVVNHKLVAWSRGRFSPKSQAIHTHTKSAVLVSRILSSCYSSESREGATQSPPAGPAVPSTSNGLRAIWRSRGPLCLHRSAEGVQLRVLVDLGLRFPASAAKLGRRRRCVGISPLGLVLVPVALFSGVAGELVEVESGVAGFCIGVCVGITSAMRRCSRRVLFCRQWQLREMRKFGEWIGLDFPSASVDGEC